MFPSMFPSILKLWFCPGPDKFHYQLTAALWSFSGERLPAFFHRSISAVFFLCPDLCRWSNGLPMSRWRMLPAPAAALLLLFLGIRLSLLFWCVQQKGIRYISLLMRYSAVISEISLSLKPACSRYAVRSSSIILRYVGIKRIPSVAEE